jgi:ubiquinone/menaquinone biosynthesis C-methylase UbiE
MATPETAAIARAFDEIAPAYDATFSESLTGRAQREAVWRVADRVFKSGDRLLEINCGTGVDAAHFSERGLRVFACDASAGMVDTARQRCKNVRGTEFAVLPIEGLGSVRERFDGVFSNFGGLNCVQDLAGFAANLERLVKPGGNVLLCYMGPFCAWETLWYGAHGQPAKAQRRWTRGAVQARVGGSTISIRYPRVSEFELLLRPNFQLVSCTGVGVFVPPSYMEGWARRMPRLMRAAQTADKFVSRWPLTRHAGDHVLLHFSREDA